MIFVSMLFALGSQSPAAPAHVLQRPRDPFVFRCVLDKRVRMVTLALADDLWTSYDTTTCSLYKSWKGGVLFDGAVYTTVHGPTPTTRGADYQKGLDGDVWMARVDDKPIESRVEWRGYRLENGGCVLEYDVVLKDGRVVRVEEAPEFARPEELFSSTEMEEWGLEAGLPGLVRRFRVADVPAGVMIAVQVRSDAPRGRFIDAGGAAQERLVDTRDAAGQVVATEIHSLLWLGVNRKTNSITQFFEPIAAAEVAPQSGAKEERR